MIITAAKLVQGDEEIELGDTELTMPDSGSVVAADAHFSRWHSVSFSIVGKCDINLGQLLGGVPRTRRRAVLVYGSREERRWNRHRDGSMARKIRRYWIRQGRIFIVPFSLIADELELRPVRPR